MWFGLKVLARNAVAFAVFLGVDVVGQALLVWAVPIESASRSLWVASLVLSLLLHLLCATFLLYCAVEAGRDPSRRLSPRDVLVGAGTRLFRVAGVLAAVGAAAALGLWAFVWLGAAVLLTLGLVPLAAAAGAPHPLAAGLSALAANALRYAWVVVVGAIVFGAVSAGAALVALFWPTPLAQAIGMTAQGVVLLWVACSLAPLLADRIKAGGSISSAPAASSR